MISEMYKRLGLVAVIGGLTAAPAMASQSVELVNEASQVAGCERLSEVRGKSSWGGLMASKAYDWSLSRMKEQAGALGATHVLLLNASSGYSGSNMLGVAYRCPAAAAEVPAPPR